MSHAVPRPLGTYSTPCGIGSWRRVGAVSSVFDRLKHRLLGMIDHGDPDVVDIPTDEWEDPIEGIRQSIMSYQEAHKRRPQIDGVVSALECHRRENHFGEKLDAIFTGKDCR